MVKRLICLFGREQFSGNKDGDTRGLFLSMRFQEKIDGFLKNLRGGIIMARLYNWYIANKKNKRKNV